MPSFSIYRLKHIADNFMEQILQLLTRGVPYPWQQFFTGWPFPMTACCLI
jgi:hypothetical protein